MAEEINKTYTSNTLYNDSTGVIAFAEQLKQELINWTNYHHVTEELGPNNRPDTQNALNNLFLSVYERFLTFLNDADASEEAINTWKEIENFLADYTDEKTLASIVAELNNKIESRLTVPLESTTGSSTTSTMTQKAITETIDASKTFTTGEKVDNVGIDNEPTANSNNLVKSGGVKGLFDSQYSESAVDLAIVDENNNAVVLFDSGHLKTKNFDSSKDATEDSRGLMPATDKTKLNGIEAGAQVNKIDTENIPDNKYASEIDVLVSDESGKSVLCLSNGHLKTKNFDSKIVLTKEELDTANVDNSKYVDLILSDGSGNAIVSFSNGHIKTKNFDSSNIKVDALEQQIEGIGTEVDGIDNRVFYLESLPYVNVETLSSNIITRCSGIFAPIGHADISYTPKKEFKILFIGNSVTQDHTGYLPWLFTQLYANDVDFTIGNFYYAGRTIKEYVQDFIKPDDPWKAQLYAVAHNTHIWTGYSNTKTLADVVSSENWDFISIQAYMQRGDAEDISMTPQLVEWLRNNCPSPFELCYLMPQCFSSSYKKATRDAATTIIKDNPVTVLFAPYFCMEEAQKYWQIAGVLSPEGDGTHLREGFPVMITGMHIMDVLCRRLGLPSRVLKNHLMMTSAINATLGNHGGNGTVDDTMATDANYINVQYCTVQGTKQAEAWYNKAINELITNYN